MKTSLPILILAPALSSAAWAAELQKADVIVYGGTSGGITAAIQAKRLGHSVILIEPTKHLGGLTTGGLGATDIGNKGAIGGMSREFYQRIKKYYQQEAVWIHSPKPKDNGEDTQWTFEPGAASKVYDAMLEEAKVPVVFGERLNSSSR